MFHNCKTSKNRQVVRKEIKYIWAYRKKSIEGPREKKVIMIPKQLLRLNRSKYSKNIIFSYLNINSIRNKFDSVRAAIVNYVDIFIAVETKINGSFPTAQFAIDGFHKPLRLDATDKSEGLLVYVRSCLLCVS